MFYARQNGQIFAEMVRLFTAGQTVDFVTLLDAVAGEGVFESADAAKVYLTGLAETVPSISNVQAYAKIVQEKYLVRQLMGAAKDIDVYKRQEWHPRPAQRRYGTTHRAFCTRRRFP